MQPKMITIWLTKYALTTGVRKLTVEEVSDRMVKEVGHRGFGFMLWARKDCALSADEAREKVAKMVAAKRKTLQKALSKLNSPISIPE